MVQVFDIWSAEVARRPSTFIDKLLEHYGNRQSNKSNGTAINQEPDLSIAMVKVERESFKTFMHSKRQKYIDIYTISLSKAKSEERQTLTKAKDRFGPHELR